MLELKEIQRSLPHATQPLDDPDLPELNARGVPRTHFLKTVPVGLVPLISPATSPTSRTESVTTTPPCKVSPPLKVESPLYHSPPSRPPPSPPSTPPPKVLVTVPPSQNPSPPKPISPPAPIVEPWVPPPPPPRLPYNIPIKPRPVPRFNFLPLLETPPSPVASALSEPKPNSRQCPPPPLSAFPVSVLLSPQDLQKTPLARSPSPRDGKVESSPSLSLPQSCNCSQPTTPDDTKDAPLEDTANLEAELTRLWHSHSCNTDGETEAEESEAESSVVHTEADSDGECTRAVLASGGATKIVRNPVVVTTASDADDDDEGEMSLVELESGVMAFVRTPRRW